MVTFCVDSTGRPHLARDTQSWQFMGSPARSERRAFLFPLLGPGARGEYALIWTFGSLDAQQPMNMMPAPLDPQVCLVYCPMCWRLAVSSGRKARKKFRRSGEREREKFNLVQENDVLGDGEFERGLEMFCENTIGREDDLEAGQWKCHSHSSRIGF